MNHATQPPVAAIVTLTSPALPKQKPFVTELRRRLQDSSIADDLQRPSPDLLSFVLGEETVSIALMRHSLPWTELEEPCLTSWWWPEACPSMQRHTSYLQITLDGKSSTPLERFILLTHIAAAVVVAVDATGVFWPTGRVVHEPKAFGEYSEGILSHAVTGGERIQAGETLGWTDGEQISVDYVPARHGAGTVMKLRFE
jgi:hypothetical protein